MDSRMRDIPQKILEKLDPSFRKRAAIKRLFTKKRPSPPANALNWIRNQELSTGGIRVYTGHSKAYPEVTGYLIPTLLDYGEKELALRLTKWLQVIQKTDGSYAGPDGKIYVFDTGQALRGLLGASKFAPEALKSAVRAADYLCKAMIREGKEGFEPQYSGEIQETIHLYVLPPLIRAAELLNRPHYHEVAINCLDFYCRHRDFLQVAFLTHFLAYELEALIEMDRTDMAIPVLERLRNAQSKNGSVRGKKNVRWICSPGLAQLAICWYRIGEWEPADKALAWLEAHQRPSGGFLGSYGPKAAYLHDVEISWAVKFYLDAHRLRVLSSFERNHHKFPSSISVDDGRAQAILRLIRPGDRVIEIGCGNGRLLKVIHKLFPDTDCTGVDISPVMLSYVPPGIECIEGSLESVPCPNNSFDVVFSVEAIEHSANPEAAISEMIRIARPGGWVLVIDKQQSDWGRKKCPSWERWPDVNDLKKSLENGCCNVSAVRIAYDKNPASDGLMVAWRGQKRTS